MQTRCLFCLAPAPLQTRLCRPCILELPWLDRESCCPRCSLPDTKGELCHECQRDHHRFNHCISAASYQWPTNKMIAAFKNRYHKGYLHTLSYALQERLQEHYGTQSSWPEVLIPVPLHKSRFIERGYNQAYLLAQRLSRITPPHVSSHLKRKKITESQQALDKKERRNNIRNAFALDSPLTYQHVAIIDDVVTTGATVNEVCRLLQKAGVHKIDVWSLARTPALT